MVVVFVTISEEQLQRDLLPLFLITGCLLIWCPNEVGVWVIDSALSQPVCCGLDAMVEYNFCFKCFVSQEAFQIQGNNSWVRNTSHNCTSEQMLLFVRSLRCTTVASVFTNARLHKTPLWMTTTKTKNTKKPALISQNFQLVHTQWC